MNRGKIIFSIQEKSEVVKLIIEVCTQKGLTNWSQSTYNQYYLTFYCSLKEIDSFIIFDEESRFLCMKFMCFLQFVENNRKHYSKCTSSRQVFRSSRNKPWICFPQEKLQVFANTVFLSDFNVLCLLSSCPFAHTELLLSNCHGSLLPQCQTTFAQAGWMRFEISVFCSHTGSERS